MRDTWTKKDSRNGFNYIDKDNKRKKILFFLLKGMVTMEKTYEVIKCA